MYGKHKPAIAVSDTVNSIDFQNVYSCMEDDTGLWGFRVGDRVRLVPYDDDDEHCFTYQYEALDDGSYSIVRVNINGTVGRVTGFKMSGGVCVTLDNGIKLIKSPRFLEVINVIDEMAAIDEKDDEE